MLLLKIWRLRWRVSSVLRCTILLMLTDFCSRPYAQAERKEWDEALTLLDTLPGTSFEAWLTSSLRPSASYYEGLAYAACTL